MAIVWNLLLLLLGCEASGGRAWEVAIRQGARKVRVSVAEDKPILSSLEEAGLLPPSNCRRGNCFTCAARVISGNPYTLRVSEQTALCDLAHSEGVVLLCSSHAMGKGIEIELDQEWLAQSIQYRGRFDPKNRIPPPPARRDPPPQPSRSGYPHFQMPELKEHLEACIPRHD
ncbi:MAG: hypothetical protein SGPRY_010026 [Prymnesium sp.]